MFELIFGIIWTTFILFMVIISDFPLIKDIITYNESIKAILPIIVFRSIMYIPFIIVGFYLLIRGVRKVYKNVQTTNYGEECYGRVLSIERNGAYVNDQPMYKVEIIVYSNKEATDYTVWEDIGFDPGRFKLGSFIKVLYYNGDVNFTENSNYAENIPESIKEYLLSKSQYLINEEEEEYIIVDGKKYISEDFLDKYRNW